MNVATDMWLARLAAASLGGTVAVGIVWLICRLFPRLSPIVRCWLWWVACLKLLIGLAPIAIANVAILPATTAAAAVRAPILAMAAPAASRVRKATIQQRPLPSALPHPAALRPAVLSPIVSILSLAALAGWLIGIGVGIGAQATALLQLSRLAMGAERLESSALSEAARRAGLPRTPSLRVSPSPIEPLTIGGIAGVLILVGRDDIARLTSEEQLSLFTHECVHIRRGDLWLSLVPWLAQTLFWFLPPAYLAVREFQVNREAACDRQTILALDLQPRAYGELLVKLSTPASPLTTPSSVMALSAGFQQLKWRLQSLESQPLSQSARVVFAMIAIVGAFVFLPWRLTGRASAALPPTGVVVADSGPVNLPNLDFSEGLAHWRMGTDPDPSPYYEVGVDAQTTHDGKASAFVHCKMKSPDEDKGDGNVLRYDIGGAHVMAKYRGKRLRWSAYVLGSKLNRKAFLFIGAQRPEALNWSMSNEVGSATQSWQHFECVADVPQDATELSLGMRLEGQGTVYGNSFRLEVVEKTVPVAKLQVIDAETEELANMSGPENLDFKQGLAGWESSNGAGGEAKDYKTELAPHGGHLGGPAVTIESTTAGEYSHGSLTQRAVPDVYLGKRIRFRGWLKTADTDEAELLIVVYDKKANRFSERSGVSSDTSLIGTKDWTKIEYIIDIPKTTQGLTFGAMLKGKGKLWIDDFKIEAIGPSQK